jgi:N-acetylmuramoyl-L-alanine amidase
VGTLRHGLFRHDRGRIVLGLEEPVAVRRVETVRGGEGAPGVALTLAPTEPEGFALTAGWPPGARWEPEAPRDRPETEDVVVLIDPGHGGIDPGASSHGLVEKTIVLDFGHRLRAHVDAVPGVTAVMTREDDRFVPLRARLAIAREVGANVLVSLHTDALASGEADGVSFYTLSRRGVDSAAEAFAERENRSDVIAGADLSGREDTLARVLIDLARRGTNAESIALARGMRGLLDGAVDLLDTRPHRFGNFYVLKAPDMPSVLVELGFLNSAADRERLTDPAWQETVAARLATAIERWVAEAPEGFLERRGF